MVQLGCAIILLRFFLDDLYFILPFAETSQLGVLEMTEEYSTIKIVYIAALGHSGSTILDIMLGAHPRLIGLGEVSTFLNNNYDANTDLLCSCGNLVSQCSFWGKVLSSIREAKFSNACYEDKYQIVISQFRKIYGQETVLVDSSKEKKFLKLISKIAEVDLKVIHLIRDVRPWTVSRKNKFRKTKLKVFSGPNRKDGISIGISFLFHFPLFLFWLWYISTIRTKKLITQEGIDSFQVGYEEIAFHADIVLPGLCAFLGIDFSKQMLYLNNTKSHIAAGNRMRLDEEKRKKFLYDNRWFYQNGWLLPSIMFPNIMQFNNREVYRHTRKSLWDK
jgi:hypothetical protein